MIIRKILAALLLSALNIVSVHAQEMYKLRIDIPLFDYKENLDLPHNYPSMNQALEWSNDLYELGFLGIDRLGELIFSRNDKPQTPIGKTGNEFFTYLAGFAFAKYGSELPVPLGIWAHEEFHRSVLGINSLDPVNGNWIFSRWNGTVYGISDEELSSLKQTDINSLLYSYVAGVQYEILLNESITLKDFYYRKNYSKAALLLYNAWYVYDYFRFSASSASDSASILAPDHEDADPAERDFAGSDLTSWVYDMFNPDAPFISREPFPGGRGVNRRIGFSDLSGEERDYLRKQKNLSLLNFINPGIFLIERIRLNDSFSFSLFTQYSPTYFGNSIALFLPFSIKNAGFLVNTHRYKSHDASGFGLGLGLYDIKLSEKITNDLRLNFWNQPASFFGTGRYTGGSLQLRTSYSFNNTISGYVTLSGKTRGWIQGDPYTGPNGSVRLGLKYDIKY